MLVLFACLAFRYFIKRRQNSTQGPIDNSTVQGVNQGLSSTDDPNASAVLNLQDVNLNERGSEDSVSLR